MWTSILRSRALNTIRLNFSDSILPNIKTTLIKFSWGAFVGLFSFIATIAGLFYGIFPNFRDQAVSLTILALFIFIVLWSFIKDAASHRIRRHQEVLAQLRIVSASISDLSTIVDGHEGETEGEVTDLVTSKLLDILQNISSLFSTATGVHCRATLKAIRRIELAEVRSCAHTLARDLTSYERSRGDDAERSRTGFDDIFENTHLRVLLVRKGPLEEWFNCNDLPAAFYLDKYQSTSIEWAYKHATEPDEIRRKERRIYPLKYKSTAVWPIRSRFNSSGGGPTPLAFLAIDSEKKNIFVPKWDKEIGATLAVQMSPFLDKYLSSLVPD